MTLAELPDSYQPKRSAGNKVGSLCNELNNGAQAFRWKRSR